MSIQNVLFHNGATPSVATLKMELNVDGITLTSPFNTATLGQSGINTLNQLNITTPLQRIKNPTVNTQYVDINPVTGEVKVTDGTNSSDLSLTDLNMTSLLPIAGSTSLIQTLTNISGPTGGYVTLNTNQTINSEKTFIMPITVVDDVTTPTITNTITPLSIDISTTSPSVYTAQYSYIIASLSSPADGEAHMSAQEIAISDTGNNFSSLTASGGLLLTDGSITNTINQKSINITEVGVSNKIEISNDATIDEPFISITNSNPNEVSVLYANSLAMDLIGQASTNIYAGYITMLSSLSNKYIDLNSHTGSLLITDDGTYSTSATAIDLNNSPDLVNDLYPYLKIKSEDIVNKYRSNLSSQRLKIDLRDLADTPIYSTSIDADIINQTEDATASNMDISYGRRIQMRYNDGDTRGIDINNAKNNEPYIEMYSSTALIDDAHSLLYPTQLQFNQNTGNNITLNNSPDLVNDFYPYLKIKSENVLYKYTSNLKSEGYTQTQTDLADNTIYQIDVSPTEISLDNRGFNPGTTYIGGLGAFFLYQSVDTTTATLDMNYGNRLKMKYTDNTREIDIYNDKDTQPYINVVGSGDVNYNYRTEINDKTIVNKRIDANTDVELFRSVVNAENMSIFTGNVETNTVGSNYYHLTSTSSSDDLFITVTTLTFSDGTNSNTLDAQKWSGDIQTQNTSANTTQYLNFSENSTTGYGKPQKNDSLSCNPSTGLLTATTFSGSLSGNVTGDVSGTATNTNNVNITSTNNTGTYFLPFVSNTGYTGVYIDNVNPTLTYDPSTSTLSTSQITLSDGTNTNTLDSLNWSGQIMAKNTSANAIHYLLFWDDANGNGATYGYPKKNSGISVNPNQHTITATTFSGSLSGNATSATTATNVSTTDYNNNITFNLVFCDGASASTELFVDVSSGPLTYNPSNGVLTTTTFTGALSGNATSATTATNVSTTNNNNNTAFNLVFCAGASGSTGLFVDSVTAPLTYNPSNGVLTTTTFTGALSGNATSATTATNCALATTATTATFSANTLNIVGSTTTTFASYSINIGGPATISSITYTTPRINAFYRVGILNTGAGDLTINSNLGGTNRTNLSGPLIIPSARYCYMNISSLLINAVTNYVVEITLLNN